MDRYRVRERCIGDAMGRKGDGTQAAADFAADLGLLHSFEDAHGVDAGFVGVDAFGGLAYQVDQPFDGVVVELSSQTFAGAVVVGVEVLVGGELPFMVAPDCSGAVDVGIFGAVEVSLGDAWGLSSWKRSVRIFGVEW
ncbi:hypothetical protein ACFQ3B_08545 [Stackebrandtia endophytica]|uniref:hypothetical protein n=1 Tax=Stackebrandtia endophytica TaxID=1496996 RepID=UPI0011504E8E|nr:hypothetical protein [Stackebrandtia endophytica]